MHARRSVDAAWAGASRGEMTMNRTVKTVTAANIVECMQHLNRFVTKTVERIYSSYMEKAQMRLAPTKPIRRRMDRR
jgi:hypothetical protein